MNRQRLQKILAQAGIASRRASEALIVAGRVRVNGRVVTELGTQAHPSRDRIEVDGKRIVIENHAYYVFHKPREVVSTMHDPEGRPSITDYIRGIPERVVPVGRLDYHTSGVLLLTNDGELVSVLLHPRKKVPKEYIAKVRGFVDELTLEKLRRGVVIELALEDERASKKNVESFPKKSSSSPSKVTTAPAKVERLERPGEQTWLRITLTEGKNRQIHRMLEVVGHQVMRLARISFAGISSDDLEPGEYRPLSEKEIEKLKKIS